MCGQRNGEASFNLKAAPALGLDVPRKLRAFADELIESVDDRFLPAAEFCGSAATFRLSGGKRTHGDLGRDGRT
jgi:hypothetical protein